MKKIRFLLAFFLISITLLNIHAQDIYVSTTGDDLTGDGTINNPYKTLIKAQTEVRQLITIGLSSPVNVYIREGNYIQDSSLVFYTEDSGTPEFPITYEAYQDESVTISGGINIDTWTKEGNFFVSDVPSDMQKLKALYKPDTFLTLARTPNKGEYYKINGAGGSNGKGAFYKRPFHEISTTWSNSGAYVNLFQHWKHSRHKIINVDGDLVEIAPEERRVLGNWDHSINYYLDNHIDMLDEPGEFFHDTADNKLYYYPMENESAETFIAIAPKVNRLIVFEGNPANGEFVGNLIFKNLSFRYTNWDANPSATLATANILLEDAIIWGFGLKDSKFENCEIAFSGGKGIWFYDGCKNNEVNSCEIYAIGDGGIYLKNEPGQEARGVTYSGNLLIEGQKIYNTLIYDLNNIHHGSHAIWMGNVENITVSHCDISGTDGSGINIGFTDDVELVGAKNITIEYNRIHDILVGVTQDWGGIHMLGSMPGTVINNNYFYNIYGYSSLAYAIYHDNGNANVTVKNNIIADIEGDAIFTKGENHVYENNIIISDGVSAFKPLALEGSLKIKRNIIYSTKSRGIYHFNETRNKAQYLEVDSNLYWCEGCESPENLDFDAGTFYSWQELGLDKHSYIDDPVFTDIENKDYSFVGEKALELGIQPIDLSEIGLEGDIQWVRKADNIPLQTMHSSAALSEYYYVDKNFSDGFEEPGIGNIPYYSDVRSPYYSTSYIGNNAPEIAITDNKAKSGVKSVCFRDNELPKATFNPNLRYYPMYNRTGLAVLEFDIFLEDGAILNLQNRGTGNQQFTLILTANGETTIDNSVLLTNTPANEWIHVKMDVPIKQNTPYMDVSISTDTENWNTKAEAVFNFEWEEALFLSDANIATNFYLDNLQFSIMIDKTVARDDFYYLSQDETLIVNKPGVLANDTTADLNVDAIKAILANPPIKGNLLFNEDGSFTYTPNLGSYGEDQFQYLVVYNEGDSNLANVFLSVEPKYPDISFIHEFSVDENSENGTEIGQILLFKEKIDLSDDFEDGDSSSWNMHNTLFSESDGVFYTGGDDIAFIGNQQWTDYTIEADVTTSYTGAGNTMGIMARYTSPGNYYSYRINGNGSVQLVKYVNNASKGLMASSIITFKKDSTYNLKMKLTGDSIKTYVNNNLVIAITDSELQNGTGGFAVLRGNGYFDNFKIYTEKESAELINDNFEDGVLDTWTTQNSQFTETGGVLDIIGDDVAFTGNQSWTNYSVEVKATPTYTGAGLTIGIAARYTDPGNYYSYRINGNGNMQLVKYKNNSSAGLMASGPIAFKQDSTYNLKLELNGSMITGYVNDAQVLQVDDSEFQQGAPGLVVLRGDGFFDDFVVFGETTGTVEIDTAFDKGYDLDGDGNYPFEIDLSNGIIKVNDSTDLDKEMFSEFFIVGFSYNNRLDTAFVKIALNDVNDVKPEIIHLNNITLIDSISQSINIDTLMAIDGDYTPGVLNNWKIINGNLDGDEDGNLLFGITQDGILFLNDPDDLQAGVYQISVTVEDGVNISDPYLIAIIVDESITSVKHNTADIGYNLLYPNPVYNNQVVNLVFDEVSQKTAKWLTITDALGKIVYKAPVIITGKTMQLNFGALNIQNGTYIVNIHSNTDYIGSYKVLIR